MEKPFVLLADDNEATCTLIRALLRADFNVETAHDGLEAIAKLKTRQYAVILVDLLMPRADGYAVLEFLATERRDALARTVILTASVTPREMERARAYEVCSILKKPFDIDDLVALARRCAGSGNRETGAPGPLLSAGILLLLADLLR